MNTNREAAKNVFKEKRPFFPHGEVPTAIKLEGTLKNCPPYSPRA